MLVRRRTGVERGIIFITFVSGAAMKILQWRKCEQERENRSHPARHLWGLLCHLQRLEEDVETKWRNQSLRFAGCGFFAGAMCATNIPAGSSHTTLLLPSRNVKVVTAGFAVKFSALRR